MKNIKKGITLIALFSFISMFSFLNAQTSKEKELRTIYDAQMTSIDGENINFSDYKGKLMLIVNTASKCGFTDNYKGLEELHRKYADKGLVVLGFPCNQFQGQEPGKNEEIKEFCTQNYGVSFQMFEKTDVNGKETPPLYTYLKAKAPFRGFKNQEVGNQLMGLLKKYQPEYAEGNEIKWNFTKFIVSQDGKTITRYETPTTIEELEKDIIKLL